MCVCVCVKKRERVREKTSSHDVSLSINRQKSLSTGVRPHPDSSPAKPKHEDRVYFTHSLCFRASQHKLAEVSWLERQQRRPLGAEIWRKLLE